MKLTLVIRVLSTLCFGIAATLAVSLSKPNCEEWCGNVVIPYPFGIGPNCSANSSFTVICRNSAKPFLGINNWEIVSISLYGTVMVNVPVSPMNCSYEPRTESLPISSLKGSPFSVSAHYNSLLVTGCNNSVWLRANEATVASCTAVCDADSTDTSCNGVNCCQTTIPTRLQELQYSHESFQAVKSSYCGYVFMADKKWLQNEDFKRSDHKFGFAPMVLEWELDIGAQFSASICPSHDINSYFAIFCREHPNDYQCQSLMKKVEEEYRQSIYYGVEDYVSSMRYCECIKGYEGNPYVHKGCRDIDECSNVTLNNCQGYETCINTVGGSYCDYGGRPRSDGSRTRNKVVIAFIVIGSVLGGLILVASTWKFGKAIVEAIKVWKASRKHMFFKKNGGLLLEQQLVSIENSIDM